MRVAVVLVEGLAERHGPRERSLFLDLSLLSDPRRLRLESLPPIGTVCARVTVAPPVSPATAFRAGKGEIRHYREQAAGGVGLLVCEYAYIDEDASKSTRGSKFRCASDRLHESPVSLFRHADSRSAR